MMNILGMSGPGVIPSLVLFQCTLFLFLVLTLSFDTLPPPTLVCVLIDASQCHIVHTLKPNLEYINYLTLL